MHAQMDADPTTSPQHAAELRAGAGRATIELPEGLFPLEGFVGVHDSLLARVLLLAGRQRVALLSLEMASLPEDLILRLKGTVSEAAGLPSENVWVCVTHTLSAPHVVPQQSCDTDHDRQRNDMLSHAIENAVRVATLQAVAGSVEARLGVGSGPCDVNVNRDMSTEQGWWLGCNEAGFSDKTLTVLRFETVSGDPIALLLSHCVRPAVMEISPGAEVERMVTSDMAGAACRLVEDEYDGSAVAMFFMGAAGDQAPSLPGARFQYVGRGKSLRVKDGDERGHIVAEMLGARLGAEALRISEAMVCRPCSGGVAVNQVSVGLSGQQMMSTHLIRPTRQYAFAPGPDRTEPVHIIRVGGSALVGLRPELSCRTGVSIRDRSPFAETLVLTMVNGGAKCMADAESYDRVTYEAMNSPFARGSAESLADAVVETLVDMAG